MSLKCSVFGHSFGEPTEQRERAEEGSEVVTTIREVEECERCGQLRVVSENTEVTALESETAQAEEPAETSPGAAPREPGAVEGSARADDGTAAQDATIMGEDGAETSDEHPADAVAQVGRGESDAGPTEQSHTPPTSEADDGIIIDDEDDDPSDERRPGQWPEESEGDEPDWVSETTPTPAEAQAGSEAGVDGRGSTMTVPEGEFYCPECDFSTDVESSSLRAGDFCPECHQGALDHRAAPE